MKSLKNVEFTLEDVDQKGSYYDLIKQAAKQPGQDGLGSLDDQMMRMAIVNKVALAEKEKSKTLSLEDAEAKALVKFQANVKFAILDKSLINYQTVIKELV